MVSKVWITRGPNTGHIIELTDADAEAAVGAGWASAKEMNWTVPAEEHLAAQEAEVDWDHYQELQAKLQIPTYTAGGEEDGSWTPPGEEKPATPNATISLSPDTIEAGPADRVVGTLTMTGAGANPTFTMINDAFGKFAVDGDQVVTKADVIGYVRHTITVKATDEDGGWCQSDIPVTVEIAGAAATGSSREPKPKRGRSNDDAESDVIVSIVDNR